MKNASLKLVLSTLSFSTLFAAQIASAQTYVPGSSLPIGDLEVIGPTVESCGNIGQMDPNKPQNIPALRVTMTLKNNGPAEIGGNVDLSGNFGFNSTSDDTLVVLKPGATKKIIVLPKVDGGALGLSGCKGYPTKIAVTGTMSYNTYTSGNGKGADKNTANNSKTFTVTYPGKPLAAPGTAVPGTTTTR